MGGRNTWISDTDPGFVITWCGEFLPIFVQLTIISRFWISWRVYVWKSWRDGACGGRGCGGRFCSKRGVGCGGLLGGCGGYGDDGCCGGLYRTVAMMITCTVNSSARQICFATTDSTTMLENEGRPLSRATLLSWAKALTYLFLNSPLNFCFHLWIPNFARQFADVWTKNNYTIFWINEAHHCI